MEKDKKYSYVAPTIEVVEFWPETYILQTSGSRGGYGEGFEI